MFNLLSWQQYNGKLINPDDLRQALTLPRDKYDIKVYLSRKARKFAVFFPDVTRPKPLERLANEWREILHSLYPNDTDKITVNVEKSFGMSYVIAIRIMIDRPVLDFKEIKNALIEQGVWGDNFWVFYNAGSISIKSLSPVAPQRVQKMISIIQDFTDQPIKILQNLRETRVRRFAFVLQILFPKATEKLSWQNIPEGEMGPEDVKYWLRYDDPDDPDYVLIENFDDIRALFDGILNNWNTRSKEDDYPPIENSDVILKVVHEFFNKARMISSTIIDAMIMQLGE